MNISPPVRIVVEGTENVGKSSLCRLLSQDFDIPIIHCGVPPTDQDELFEFYRSKFVDACLENEKGFIFDRFIWSNWSYNGIFGGGVLDSRGFKFIEELMYSECVYPILLTSGNSEIKDRIANEYKEWEENESAFDGKMPLGNKLSLDQIDEIQKRFLQLFTTSSCDGKLLLQSDQVIEFRKNREPKRLSPLYNSMLEMISVAIATRTFKDMGIEVNPHLQYRIEK